MSDSESQQTWWESLTDEQRESYEDRAERARAEREVYGHELTEERRRLEYLRGEIRAERIGWGEIAELQGLAEHIPAGDVELLEWAGVPEHEEEKNYTVEIRVDVRAASPEEAERTAWSSVTSTGRITAVMDEEWEEV